MSGTITISGRFCGPPNSANGGYACGVTALALTDGPADVMLRRPPPLDRPMRVESTTDHVAVYDGDFVVAEARPGEPDLELPEPVGYDAAVRAAEAFDVDAYASSHVFGTCFTCGPGRNEGDGLRLFPAESGRSDGFVVWPWVPHPSIADDTGLVSGAAMWAALDCPSGMAWLADPEHMTPAVLGRMTAVVHRRPEPGEELIVAGWRISADGRKLRSGSAIWSADGDVLAVNAATWIQLSEEQLAAFGGTGGSA